MQLQGILQSSRELDALKSLSSSPLAKSHRKQMTMNSNLRSSNQLINGGSTEGQTMVTVGEGPSSSEMLLLSEVALLLETSNNQAVAVLKTTTTTTTTTTTEVSSQKGKVYFNKKENYNCVTILVVIIVTVICIRSSPLFYCLI